MSELIQAGVTSSETSAAKEPALKNLDASLLRINRTTTPRKVPEPNSNEVWSQRSCADHMISVTWTSDVGWHAPEINPYGSLTIMPTASCLHYATSCFEGMKVYRGYDGKLRLFRPDRNCQRLVLSSSRVSLPTFDPLELEKLIKVLVKLDAPRKIYQVLLFALGFIF